MKQTNHAPQPLWRRRLPGYAAMGAASLVLALGLHGLMNARTTGGGTALALTDADAATYGISAVYQLDENTYYVVGSQKGFQSDVEVGVTLGKDGTVQSVAILAQGETDNLGGQCVNPEFTAQYQGTAPFTLAGKSYTVTEAPAEDFDPSAWRAGDTSPEAEATRKRYEAGLTLSALHGEPMDNELIPPMDSSAEAVASRKLYQASLSKSAQDGEEQAKPFADWSAEKQAAYRLEQAELTTSGTGAETSSADLTEVDALTGATITSTAVTNVVNNSYFYVTEVLSAE